MPRRPPDSVIETRHALGAWERKQVETITTAASLGAVGLGVGVAAVGVGGVLAGYALYQWLKDGPFKDIEELWDDIKDDIIPFRDNEPTAQQTWSTPEQRRGWWGDFWAIFDNGFYAPWDMPPLEPPPE